MKSTQKTSRRVLFVAYLFPPTGGVSVQRVRKFVKYLPEHGWDVSVLTVSNPSVPLRDESLLDEIPPQTAIHTARTYEPGYATKESIAAAASESHSLRQRILAHGKRLARAAITTVLQPDAAILWYPQAVREGLRILREQPHDVIVVTAPPFSSLLVGAELARRSGVPLVLDYRDEWTINKTYLENRGQDRLSNWLQQGMQRRVLRTAHTIVATTPGSARALAAVARQAGSQAASTHIYNGFDPTDYPEQSMRTPRRNYGHGVERLRIAYLGTLWKLTSIEPFLRALERLAGDRPELLDRLEVIIAGRQVPAEQALLQRLAALPCRFANVGFLEHRDALELMVTSDWLLQLLSDLPAVERVVASKLFEYMGARRPILAISGRGDHWDIVSRLPGATLFHPDQTDKIADAIATRLEQHRGEPLTADDGGDLAEFERRHLTSQLAQLLDGVIAGDAINEPVADCASPRWEEALA